MNKNARILNNNVNNTFYINKISIGSFSPVTVLAKLYYSLFKL